MHFEYIIKWSTKIFWCLHRPPTSPFWDVLWLARLNILAPRRGGGGRELHMGAPPPPTLGTRTATLAVKWHDMKCNGISCRDEIYNT